MHEAVLILMIAFTVAGLFTQWAAASLSQEQAEKLPPAAGHEVDFVSEVKPIFESSCVQCHARGKAKGGFSLENRALLLKGGDSGPAIVAGSGAGSYLIELVSGLNPEIVMPQKGSRLKPAQVGVLRAWIDQGAAWNPQVTFARTPPLNLTPRRPELPPGAAGVTHPIDRILAPYYAAHGVKPPKRATDRVYGRRVYLDTIGLLPAPDELDAFVRDRAPDKRARLVRRLLSDHRRYAEHWLSFWNDALRNDYQGTGYIDEGRKQITGWLFAALANDLPFDQFVRELINPGPASEGFARGIVWRGVVNASQTPPLQAAQNISQVFLGVNLKCASCHDSFINDWTLADAYGLASIYAEEPLEMVRCDKPTGQIAPMKFLYPQMGEIDTKAPKTERLKQLAAILTAEADGRLTRTIVNRLWARFLGRGLVEPPDDMDRPAWSPALLDWLAADLVDHGYDLKRTMELILTSSAYQGLAVPALEQPVSDYVFRGPCVRRLSGEQYLDALSAVTGEWHVLPSPQAELAGVPVALIDPTPLPEPYWIWNTASAAERAEAGTVRWRKTAHLPEPPAEAAVVATCDNRFTLYVNGQEVLSGNDPAKPKAADIRKALVRGDNVLAVEAVNALAKPDDPAAEQANPAGLILYARIRCEDTTGGGTRLAVHDVVTDKSWVWSAANPEGWQKTDFAAADWQPAAELGGLEAGPWHLGGKLRGAVASTAFYGRVRAALANNDPLMSALGRPNREQVLTSRATVATTLQALELTNGSTLAEFLDRGAERLLRSGKPAAADLVAMVYARALGRQPTRDERRLAEGLVGSPVEREGVEDLLWAVAMLPEFQLIY